MVSILEKDFSSSNIEKVAEQWKKIKKGGGGGEEESIPKGLASDKVSVER